MEEWVIDCGKLLDKWTKVAAEKQTLSTEGAEKLEVAVKLARISIPQEHPLLKSFMKEVAFISEEYSDDNV
jgi:hypothetical protein